MLEIITNIFKEYDIRGKIGKELNEEVAFKLGQLFYYNLAQKTVVIGRDNRPSSEALLKGFVRGMINSGCEVMELEGVVTSPHLYFASELLKTGGAVMVTGSHNSLEDNGLKFLLSNKPFYGNDLKNILTNPIIDGNGKHKFINLDQEYAQTLTKNIKINKPNRIIWECNNSGIAKIIPLLNLLGKHEFLNRETSGVFGHKLPDPLIEKTLTGIKQKVSKYDYGLAFDGDADRLVLIKPDGIALTSDQLIYLFALSLRKISNKKIIVDVKASQILIDALKEDGFEVIIAPSGHSLMKERIKNENAIFAGETSGHIIFNDEKYFAFDDALYAALRIMEYLQDNPIIELPLAKFKKEFKIAKISGLDAKVYKPEGLRISYPDGFLLVRASNTEDYILVKYEAMTENVVESIKEKLNDIL